MSLHEWQLCTFKQDFLGYVAIVDNKRRKEFTLWSNVCYKRDTKDTISLGTLKTTGSMNQACCIKLWSCVTSRYLCSLQPHTKILPYSTVRPIPYRFDHSDFYFSNCGYSYILAAVFCILCLFLVYGNCLWYLAIDNIVTKIRKVSYMIKNTSGGTWQYTCIIYIHHTWKWRVLFTSNTAFVIYNTGK